ncbi:MAG: hypothetical protein ACTSSP_01465 [Candidatus Asgardarchaeia archaeon]
MEKLRKFFEYIKKNIKEYIEDCKGSPLMEEALLIGVALLTVTLLLTMILDIMGWSQNIINTIYNQLDNIEKGLMERING